MEGELETEVENGPAFVATLRQMADLHRLITAEKLDPNFET